MTNAELKAYKKILAAKEAELVGALRNREGIEIEKSPDALAEVQRAAERELAIRTLDRESSLRRETQSYGRPPAAHRCIALPPQVLRCK